MSSTNHNAGSFMQQIQARLSTLLERLETIDVQLVGNLHESINKKRSASLFYKSQGQISTYRCLSKGLPSERVIDYFGIVTCKMRVQEIISLIANQDKFDANVKSVNNHEVASATIKMSKVLELDSNIYNTECGNSEKPEFKKYQEDCGSILEE